MIHNAALVVNLSFLVAQIFFLSAQKTARFLPAELEDFLRDQAGFSDSAIADVERGKSFAKLLHSDEKREIAVLGVVQVDVPKKFFVDRFRNIVTFKKSYAVPEIGMFSEPPRLDDLNGLSVPPRDIKDMRKCMIGDCKVRLSEQAIERFQKEIDWSAQNYQEQTTFNEEPSSAKFHSLRFSPAAFVSPSPRKSDAFEISRVATPIKVDTISTGCRRFSARE